MRSDDSRKKKCADMKGFGGFDEWQATCLSTGRGIADEHSVSAAHYHSGLVTALGLAFGSVALAQSPPPAPPSPPADAPPSIPAAPATSSQLPVVTQSSRVRAFNAGPSGEVRSLYLQNGSVVDLTPALGGQLGPAVRKGEKITVTGTKSEINGQSFVEAASVRLNDQTFSANAPSCRPSRPWRTC